MYELSTSGVEPKNDKNENSYLQSMNLVRATSDAASAIKGKESKELRTIVVDASGVVSTIEKAPEGNYEGSYVKSTRQVRTTRNDERTIKEIKNKELSGADDVVRINAITFNVVKLNFLTTL